MTRVEVFSDRTDVRTLPPMLNTLSWWHQTGYEEVVADAGYESMENYLYLDQNRQMYFIKPAFWVQDKKLYLRRETTEIRDGQLVSTIWYQCEDCSGCSCRAQCCRAR